MIAGIGMDLIELSRIAGIMERYGERFLARVLGPEERRAMHGDPVAYVAGRFAAKEAGLKALGTGLSAGVGWQDIQVLNRPSGAPTLRLLGEARRQMTALDVVAAHVTVTHSREHAAACVVLEAADAAQEMAPLEES